MRVRNLCPIFKKISSVKKNLMASRTLEQGRDISTHHWGSMSEPGIGFWVEPPAALKSLPSGPDDRAPRLPNADSCRALV